MTEIYVPSVTLNFAQVGFVIVSIVVNENSGMSVDLNKLGL